MIDSDVINAIEGPLQGDVRRALGVLAIAGVIESQLVLESSALFEGASDEDPAELAKRIIEYRVRTQTMESFRQLCLSHVEEVK